MTNALRRLAVTAAASLAVPCGIAQITVTEYVQGGATKIRGWVATIDLADPRVEVLVTAPPAGGGESVLTRTDTWAAQVGAALAVNANFFSTLSGGAADIIGLSATNGTIVSPARQFDLDGDPALLITQGKVATIDDYTPAEASGAYDAVAGIGPSNTDSDPGTLLVTDGVNTGATARVQPLVRNPRTAVGVSQDGRTLIIAVIDGRQSNWSVGMTLPELANLMIANGAWRAINLDGGGSSSFIYEPEGGNRVENRPSDGAHRAVANHLGIRLNPEPSNAIIDERPIRGVWLRPPASLISLETTIFQLAQAGVQDLYLETFYHGLATNDSDVFNDRFPGTDYLAEAVKIGAKYSMRVHAWLETGYWSFSGSGQYLFDQYPGIEVVPISGTQTGDQAGQVFVNLGNPLVQVLLRDYVEELAGYPGLWGIQIDYHRMPLGQSNTAIWSYDAWASATMLAQYGVNIFATATAPGATHWNLFTQFRRDGISEAANQMHQGINDVNAGIDFSAAIFASAMTSSAQLSKMQDWPRWARDGYVETIIPMAYGTTTTSIRNDLSLAKSQAAGRKVVPGLAIINPTTRPGISAQLDAVKAEGLEDEGFVFFEATMISGSPANQQELRNWLLSQGSFQRADINRDMYVDGRDRNAFYAVYQGSPVAANGSNATLDLDASGFIDADDEAILMDQFRRNRFGEDGVVDERDLAALNAVFTGPVGGIPDPILNLFDLDADGDVDVLDRNLLISMYTSPPQPIYDVDGNGVVDIDDLYAQIKAPIDVNQDGLVTNADTSALEAFLRDGEVEDMTAGRR